MDRFDSYKSIWLSEEGRQIPSADEFLDLAKRYKRRSQRLTIWVIIILLACFISFFGVWFGYESTMWTTKFGEILIFVTILYYIYYTYKDLQKKRKLDVINVNTFLYQLKSDIEETKLRKSIILKFITLYGISYGFFIYENASVNQEKLIISYTILIAFVMFLWFVFRPIVFKIHNKKVYSTINKIVQLQNEINEYGKDK